MSAITSDPSRNIEWTSNWIVSDAVHVVDDVLSITLSVDVSVVLGEQLFQHWMEEIKAKWILKIVLDELN